MGSHVSCSSSSFPFCAAGKNIPNLGKRRQGAKVKSNFTDNFFPRHCCLFPY